MWPFGRRRTGPKPSLAVTVVTLDRLRELEGLLRNVDDIADEIVVVDGGSRDGSRELVLAHPRARLVERSWDRDFAVQKNLSFDHAKSDWVLHLDTDERVGSELKRRLPALLAGRNDFYRIPMYWVVSEDPLLYLVTPKHYPCHVPRLFRNRPEFRYEVGAAKVHVTFPKAVRRGMRKVRGAHLFHFCLVWNTREALEAKSREYESAEPGSDPVNSAYYRYWEHPHRTAPCEETVG